MTRTPSPKVLENRARRRAEVGAALLGAVEDLLNDGASYTALSVEEILKAAGITRSTFYAYFDGKGDLLAAWLERIVEDIEDATDPWWRVGPDATRDDLRDAVAELAETYRPHVTLMGAVYDVAAFEPNAAAAIDELVRRGVSRLRAHLKRGQKGGWIDPSLPPAETAAWLTAMSERGLLRLLPGTSDEEVAEIVESHADVLWFALYAQAPTRAGAGG